MPNTVSGPKGVTSVSGPRGVTSATGNAGRTEARVPTTDLPSASLSTVVASPTTVATGVLSTITVTIKDAAGAPMENVVVVLAATGTGNTLTQPNPTNASGVTTGSLSSTVGEVKVVSALANGIAITQTASVTVVAFAPSDLAGLAAWYKGDGITGLVDGDPVGSWTDSSGNGRHATQGTAAAKPTYKTGILNGKPVVRFDGVDDLLASAAFTAIPAPYTAFFVFKVGAVLANVLDLSGQPNSNNCRVQNAGNTWQLVGGANPSDGAATVDVWYLVVCLWNGASSYIRVNGLQTNGDAGTSNAAQITLGALNSAGGFGGASGDFAEAGLYSRALSDSERAQVETYLTAKYGL